MLKKTITYEDYDGQTRTEDFYFNLNKAELMEMEYGTTGGYTTMLKRIIAAQDVPEIMKVFKELILKSYGIKSPDGKRFIKSAELSEEFVQTEAYTNLFMELFNSGEKAVSDFMLGVLPREAVAEAKNTGALDKAKLEVLGNTASKDKE